MPTIADNSRPGAGPLERLADDFMRANGGRPIATAQEAAGLLRISRRRLYDVIAAGQIATNRVCSGGMVLIQCGELARWFVDGERRYAPNVD